MKDKTFSWAQYSNEQPDEASNGPRALALAVIERAVWDLSNQRWGKKGTGYVCAKSWLYAKAYRVDRLFWCSFLGEDPALVEEAAQEWGRQVMAGEIEAKPKTARVISGKMAA